MSRKQLSCLVVESKMGSRVMLVRAKGLAWMEHPEDRNRDPYASVWETLLMKKYEMQTRSRRWLFDQ